MQAAINDNDEEENTDQDSEIVEMPITKKKETKTKPTKRNAKLAEDDGTTYLYDIIFRSTKKQFSSEAAEWIACYKRNKIAAIADLMNMVLMVVGTRKEWIAQDVDLEPLESEEITELLSDFFELYQSSNSMTAYPLKEIKKNSFREKFSSFWTQLVTALIEEYHTESHSKTRSDLIIRMIIERLITFSTLQIVNIRDGATEAALTIGMTLLQHCKTICEEYSTKVRQINAEEVAKPYVKGSSNQKYQTMLKQRDSLRQELDAMIELCDLIFDSILIHRLKDIHPLIRSRCLHYLNEWIVFDPTMNQSIKVENLKYLGWMCSDHDNDVRWTAMNTLLDLVERDVKGEITANMRDFIERFIDRFVEIAAGDIDPRIQSVMLQVMIHFQKKGLLDIVQVEKLDLVDATIFDEKASLECRTHALSFVMYHTEGFEDIIGESTQQPVINNKKSKAKSSASSTIALAKDPTMQKVRALQLETLTEFAELHLFPDTLDNTATTDVQHGFSVQIAEKIFLLVEACDNLPRCDILKDFPTMLSLLLRESEDLITRALRPTQIYILLGMFIASAKSVSKDNLPGTVTSLDMKIKHKSNSSTHGGEWKVYNEIIIKKLPALIIRFQEDPYNLFLLVQGLECCDYSNHLKELKLLCKSLLKLLESRTEESILFNIVLALNQWSRLDGSTAEYIHSLLTTFSQKMLSELNQNLRLIQGFQNNDGTKSRKSNKNSKIWNQLEDAMYALTAGLVKLKCMWKAMDVRLLEEEDVDLQISDVFEIANFLPNASKYFQTIAPSLSDGTAIERLCTRGSIDAAIILQLFIVWNFKDFFEKTQQKSEISLENEEEEEANQPSLASLTDKLLTLRESFVQVLMSWMELSNSFTQDDTWNINHIASCLSREAFAMMNDLRNLFPLRYQKMKRFERLAFIPNQEILSSMRRVFENEGKRIQKSIKSMTNLNEQQKDQPNEDILMNNKEITRLQTALINTLLCPLSSSLLLDIDNLNRRQAAAIMHYVLDPNEAVQETVKAVIKKLKDGNIVKYLEVQLIALKGFFSEYVIKLIRQRALQQMDDELVNEKEIEKCLQIENENYEQFDVLGKHLSRTLGIGKLKGEAGMAMVNFFKAGIDFALSDYLSIGYTMILSHYLRFLHVDELEEVRNYFNEIMKTKEELLQELDNESSELQREIEMLKLFMSKIIPGFKASLNKMNSFSLPKKSGNKTTKKRFDVKDDVDSVVDDSPVVLKQQRAVPVKKGKGNPKPLKLPDEPTRTVSRRTRSAKRNISYEEDDTSASSEEEIMKQSRKKLKEVPTDMMDTMDTIGTMDMMDDQEGGTVRKSQSSANETDDEKSSSESKRRRSALHQTNDDLIKKQNIDDVVMGLELEDLDEPSQHEHSLFQSSQEELTKPQVPKEKDHAVDEKTKRKIPRNQSSVVSKEGIEKASAALDELPSSSRKRYSR